MLATLGAAIVESKPNAFWLCIAALAALAVGSFVFGFRRLQRARLLEDTPPSRIRSAAQGYVELRGFARLLPGPPIVSPLTGTRCVWWKFRVEQRRDYHDGSRQRREWQLLRAGCSEELFTLADDSGECIVDPYGAEVLPSQSRAWSGHTPFPGPAPRRRSWFSVGGGQYRYRELLVCVGDPLYAHGRFQSQSAVTDTNVARDVRELLADWKRDHRELLRRFDTDGDGQISLVEWEAARAAALAEVRNAQLERSLQPDLHVLRRPGDGRRFLISTLSQEQLARRLRRSAALLVSASLPIAIATAWLLIRRFGSS
ncbi:GIDE domain-containing protein [Solimonas marina]|uniref:EF-hand domain-containing protein n=1 Tax=Solimonas marina TaxID=2714601 RepID=A0A970B6J3_9GAMM|nr:GIDE domain-containing protein [Solimonas marina]NKF22868.1 hypothetical protein [Solimonas marina]